MSSVSTGASGAPEPEWWRSPTRWRAEILAAMVVGVALIPEAISFSVVAHVSPSVGLYASFIMAMTIAIVGGRSAMISAATSAYTTAGTCTRSTE